MIHHQSGLPRHPIQLICLPYAGGGTAVFHRWRPWLPETIELRPICLPGREQRLAEPPFTNIESAVHEIADFLGQAANEPRALLGHSMGALIAFELAREMRRRGMPSPRLLVVSACRAPDSLVNETVHTLPDDEFLADVQRRFQAVPREMMENEELRQVMLPILRADIELFETYHYRDEPPLDVELFAIGGADDSSVGPADLEHWRRHTSGNFTARRFPGGHFFLFDKPSPSGKGQGEGLSPPLAWITERLVKRQIP